MVANPLEPDLSVELAPRKGLVLSNPVMVASGTFGYGEEYAELIDIQRLGAIISKGVTLEPRSGNPQPRLVETPAGLLNSIGLENIGLEALIREKAPLWAGWRVPVLVNIAGQSLEEYAELARRLEGVPGVRGLEVNLGCPNLPGGGMEFGTDPDLAAKVTEEVATQTSLPIIVKLSPNVTDIVGIAKAVVAAGADALTLANTVRAMAIDLTKRQPALGGIFGGLSGPAIKPIALYLIYRVAQEVEVPLIGCGGISTAEDALEFILAGASAIQVGTAIFANPTTPLEILEDLRNFLVQEGIEHLSSLVGVANRGRNEVVGDLNG